MGILALIESRKKEVKDLVSIVTRGEDDLHLKGKIMIYNQENTNLGVRFGFIMRKGLFCVYDFNSHNLNQILELECNLSYAVKYRNDVIISGKYKPGDKQFDVSYIKIRDIEANKDRIYHFE